MVTTTVSMTTFKHTEILPNNQLLVWHGETSGKQADNESNCLPRAATHCSYKFQRHIFMQGFWSRDTLMYHMSGMRIFEVFPPSPSEHLITNLGCHISHSPKGPGYIGTYWIQTLNLKIAVVEIVGTIILQNIRIFFSFFKNYFDDNFLFIFFNMKYLSFFSFF